MERFQKQRQYTPKDPYTGSIANAPPPSYDQVYGGAMGKQSSDQLPAARPTAEYYLYNQPPTCDAGPTANLCYYQYAAPKLPNLYSAGNLNVPQHPDPRRLVAPSQYSNPASNSHLTQPAARFSRSEDNRPSVIFILSLFYSKLAVLF